MNEHGVPQSLCRSVVGQFSHSFGFRAGDSHSFCDSLYLLSTSHCLGVSAPLVSDKSTQVPLVFLQVPTELSDVDRKYVSPLYLLLGLYGRDITLGNPL